MAADKPDHHDAEIVIKLYDLRREAVMRDSRHKMVMEFTPKNYDEFFAVASDMTHPHNVAFRQTVSYWEMVFGMAKNEVVNAEYLVENSGEGMLMYAKCQPYLERYREEVSPFAFRHAEWAATQTEMGRTYVDFMQTRMKDMLSQD